MEKATARDYDVVIVGAGVTGTALLYVLAKYTDVRRVAVIEKYAGVAEVSSHSAHNSQTLHFGDIETNYTLEKAGKVKAAAEMIVKYVEGLADGRGILRRMQKMVLGVGEKEVALLKARAAEFASMFPSARFIGADELRALEPKVMEGRRSDEPVAAIHSERGYACDFGRLAQSLADDAKRARPMGYDFFFGTAVRRIARRNNGFVISTDRGDFTAAAVVVAAGAHSLSLARDMGFGKDYTLLPVAGDFFTAPNVLRGKVYTVQEKKLPFAAVHADPDVGDDAVMRFGPIARAMPILEPHRWRTAADFFKVFKPDIDTIATVIKVNSEPVVRKFVLRHIFYYVPLLGKYFFLAEGRKIVPTLKANDLRFARRLGGIRPQVADKKARGLLMGEAKIAADGIIFNITPSPGATVCLKNAEEDARRLMAFFGGRFRLNEASFKADLG